jgi:nitrate reductase delta subunit
MRALKALAALLSYPRVELIDALPEIRVAIAAERRIAPAERSRLAALADELAASDLLEAQELYVAIFDRGRTTSLNLFEHLHGDSRDRGQAMVDLAATYARAGLALETRELPDYLPVLLEYLSTRPFAEVEETLRDCAHLLRAIGEALERRRSPYAAVIAALLGIAGEARLAAAAEPEASAEEAEASLDEEWAEQPVLFGLGCGDARQASGGVKPVRFVRKVA